MVIVSENKNETKMALKKVKGNFERMFDKNLTDLVRGIRNNKDNEVSFRFRSIHANGFVAISW